jgi:hypothetical protein
MSRLNFRLTASLAAIAIAPIATNLVTHQSSATGQGVVPQRVQEPTPPKPSNKSPLNVKKVGSTGKSPADDLGKSIASAESDNKSQGSAELKFGVCEFLTEYVKAAPVSKTTIPPTTGNKGQTPPCPDVASHNYRVVIAIFPDPVHTHLALRFDRSIDDLQDAMQDLGWIFDHSWLPRDNKIHGESDRYQEREIDEAARRGREEHNPGLLFFRNGPEPLIVLLVGDTPTRGVNPNQFKAAIEMWKKLRPDVPAPDSLSILGPSFSGSADSLRQLLDQSCAAGKVSKITVISGTMTSGKQLDLLNGVTTVAQKNPVPPGCGKGIITASSLAMDVSYEHTQLLTYLKNHGINDRHDVLDLREAESKFGERNPDPGNQNDPNGWRVLHFPREISQLRNAYEQNGIIGFVNTSTAPRTQLHFGPGDDPHDDDTVPEFSGQQYTLAMESEIAQIASTLNTEGIQAVLLSATDVLDEIFVARYLQQHAPKTTVIIEDADLLFLRSGEDARLDNTYVATPWPLIYRDQHWSAMYGTDDALPHLFQSQGDQGLHNAALYLLRYDQPLFEYMSPFGAANGNSVSRPPLWLSVIGHGKFSPVALVDIDQGETKPSSTVASNLPRLSEPDPTHDPSAGTSLLINGINNERLETPAKVIAAAIALMILCHGTACVWARLDRRFAWIYALADEEYRTPRLLFQAALSFIAVPALGLLRIPASEGLVVQPCAFQWCIALLQAASCLLTAYAIARVFMGPHRTGCEVLFVIIMLIFMALSLLLGWITNLNLWEILAPSADRSSERLFFLYRSSQLLSGSSPALVLLLLTGACAYWLHSHFGRLSFFGHRIPALPPGPEDSRYPTPERVKPLTDLFCNVKGWNTRLAIYSAAAVGLALLVTGSWGPHSLAHGIFDNVVCVSTFVIAVMILHDVLIAVCGWHLLRQKCLLPLKNLPLRWGFNWIKGFSWRRIWTGVRNMSPEILFDYMTRLDNANSRARSNVDLRTAYHNLRRQFYKPEKEKNEGWAIAVAERILEVHAVLAKVASTKLNALEEL